MSLLSRFNGYGIRYYKSNRRKNPHKWIIFYLKGRLMSQTGVDYYDRLTHRRARGAKKKITN